jgi:hypothetical protein
MYLSWPTVQFGYPINSTASHNVVISKAFNPSFPRLNQENRFRRNLIPITVYLLIPEGSRRRSRCEPRIQPMMRP